MPKKGRPVTQCQHCRQERKKRSAHVSCDCGDSGKHHHPREKCIHLREAEERAKAGVTEEPPIEKDPAHLATIAEEQGCCCHHGGKCTCSVLKRESGAAGAPHGPAVKPRLEKTTSDGAITHFANGHHKPVHRKNNAAHEHGMPYRMPVPRSNSQHSSDNDGSLSSESLPLENTMQYQQGTWLPLTSAPFNPARRRSKSEQTSPRLDPSQNFLGGLPDFNTPPMDFASLTPMRTNESSTSAASSNMEFPPFDQMSGFSEDELDPWTDMSALDTTTIKPNQGSMQAWSSGSPDPMYGGQPLYSHPPSAAPSESDDAGSIESLYGISMPNYQGDNSGFNLDMSNPNSPQVNRHSLPPGFFGNTDFTHGAMSNEWQQAVANSAAAHQGNLSASPLSMEAGWPQQQQPQSRSSGTTNSPISFESSPAGSRPQSRSVGPSSAPNNDALRELFPDMDLDNIPNLSQSQPHLSSRKTFGGLPSSSMPTSAPINFEPQQPMQASPESGMATQQQPWNDGSYSIPHDGFGPGAGGGGGGGSGSGYESGEGGYTSQPYTPPEWAR